VSRKRGFLAELHYQNQLVEKRRQQAATAAARGNAAAARAAEQARRHAGQALAHMERATAAENKRAAVEAQRLHDTAMQAEAEAKNAELAQTQEEIETILGSALRVDTFVNLEQFRRVAKHPRFTRSDLETPLQPPALATARDEPVYVEPTAPTGLGGLLGGKKRHEQAVAATQAAFAQQRAAWEAEVAGLPAIQLRQMQDYQDAEQTRVVSLEQARREYQAECARRETEVATANQALDHLIEGLTAGEAEQVQEYVGIVLGSSAYPDSFAVDHDCNYDAALRELSITTTVPLPNTLPGAREFRYVRAKGEIVPTLMTQKDQKERYLQAAAQVALRTLHEVFTADRTGTIQTIALTVATEGIDTATGLNKKTNLIAVAAERSRFQTYDLAKVVPLSTLQYLNALISKSPFDLIGIDAAKTVRG
jgi:restriction system protein